MPHIKDTNRKSELGAKIKMHLHSLKNKKSHLVQDRESYAAQIYSCACFIKKPRPSFIGTITA